MILQRKRAIIVLFLILNFSWLSPAQDRTADSLNRVLNNARHDTARSAAMVQLGKHFQHQLPDTALVFFNKASALVAEDELKKAQITKLISEVYFEKGDYTSSARLYEEVRGITAKPEYAGNKQAQKLGVSVIGNLGLVYMDKGDLPKATEYYFKALKLYEGFGDKQGQAVNHGNIGICYAMMGDLPKALEFFYKAYNVNVTLGYKAGQVDNLTNIGTVYKLQGEYEKALEMMNKGLKIDVEQGNKIGQAALLGNMATVYSDQANALTNPDERLQAQKKAIDCNFKALKLNEELNRKKGQVINLLNVFHIYLEQKNYAGAEKLMRQADMLAASMKALDLSKEIHNGLSLLYERTRKPDLALKHYKLFIQYRDSIYNEENSRKAIQQEYKFNYEKKAATDSIIALEERKLTGAKLKQERTQRFALYGGLGIMLVFAGVMYNRFKVTNRQKKVIEIKEKETQSQNEIITHQKNMVEEKQKEILDSIGYAKRIQNTLLAHHEFLQQQMPDHFVLFQPKDIVSGDFYWAIEKNNRFYMAVCDSTGHGVPGAFMSLLNISFLNEAINEKNILQPNEVFNFVRQRLIDNISRDGQKDGFDGILICLDRESNNMTYSAANNAPILIRDNEIMQLQSDRMPVGIGERTESFSLFSLALQKDDMLYLYTDGYADQFGGPKGKKFKYKPLNEMLLALHAAPCEVQARQLKHTLNEWKGELEQIDDVCLVGIRL